MRGCVCGWCDEVFFGSCRWHTTPELGEELPLVEAVVGYVGPRTRSCGGTLGEKQKPPTEEKEGKEKKLLSGILALQYLIYNSVV